MTKIYKAAKNIFVATWCSLGRKTKDIMQQFNKKFEHDGPTFLWFLFCYYNITAAQIVRTSLGKINKSGDKLAYIYKYNIDK